MTAPAQPRLDAFIEADELNALIQRAREEDLGPTGLDITTRLFVPQDLQADAHIVARQPGTLSGGALLQAVIRAYDPSVTLRGAVPDGALVAPGQSVATLTGPMQSILTIERIALNLVTHLSGIATLTARFVQQTTGTKARIYDTRKTLPGLRRLQKYAVACGGGATHRMGLYDAVLLKDNHLAHLGIDQLSEAVTQAVQTCRAAHPDLKFIMIEVDTLNQLKQVLTTGVDLVLLDNMPPEQLRQAVSLRDELAPQVELEASGGVNLDTVQAIAQTGVDRISIGALTHSAPAMDFGLDIRS